MIVAMKLRNPRFGNVRIAQQISHAFGIEIDKDFAASWHNTTGRMPLDPMALTRWR